MGVRYEREYPEWPWKVWGGVEADKAKLEEAVHRAAQAKWWLEQGGMNWERCSHCGERREMNVVEGSERRMPKTGRYPLSEVRCAECWEVSCGLAVV